MRKGVWGEGSGQRKTRYARSMCDLFPRAQREKFLSGSICLSRRAVHARCLWHPRVPKAEKEEAAQRSLGDRGEKSTSGRRPVSRVTVGAPVREGCSRDRVIWEQGQAQREETGIKPEHCQHGVV